MVSLLSMVVVVVVTITLTGTEVVLESRRQGYKTCATGMRERALYRSRGTSLIPCDVIIEAMAGCYISNHGWQRCCDYFIVLGRSGDH